MLKVIVSAKIMLIVIIGAKRNYLLLNFGSIIADKSLNVKFILNWEK